MSKQQNCHTIKVRNNERDGVSNHRRLDGLLDCLFRHRSNKIAKLRVTGLCEGNSAVNSPHKEPVTRKMFPFDDVIMLWTLQHGYTSTGKRLTKMSQYDSTRPGSHYLCLSGTLWHVFNVKSFVQKISGNIFESYVDPYKDVCIIHRSYHTASFNLVQGHRISDKGIRDIQTC